MGKEKLNTPLFNWGDIVTDCVTGFTGAVIGYQKHIIGPDAYLVAPKAKYNKYNEPIWLSGGRLKAVSPRNFDIPGEYNSRAKSEKNIKNFLKEKK